MKANYKKIQLSGISGQLLQMVRIIRLFTTILMLSSLLATELRRIEVPSFSYGPKEYLEGLS